MRKGVISILLVEDNPGDARLVSEMLKECITLSFRLTHAGRLEDALEMLKAESFDIALLDLDLTDSSGLATLERFVRQEPGIPVIVLTGFANEDMGLQALQRQAGDYLVKGRIDGDLLIRSIRHSIERKRIEQEMARERANLQTIFDFVNVGMLLISEDGVVRRVNHAVSQWVGKDLSGLCGIRPGNLVGCIYAIASSAPCGGTAHCASCPIRNTFESAFRSGQSVHGVEAEVTLMVEGREVRMWLELNADLLILGGERHVILAMSDITERKGREAELHRLNRTLKALSDTNQAMIRARD
jgi:CheY-like chemotaxis protein